MKKMTKQTKIYTHKQYFFYDEKGRKCVIRCSFDKDRFFLRSFTFEENGKKYRPKLMEHSIVGSFEFKEKL